MQNWTLSNLLEVQQSHADSTTAKVIYDNGANNMKINVLFKLLSLCFM